MRWPTPLTPIIIAKLIGGGGGGSVTAAAVLSAMEAMTASQASDALEAIDGEPRKLTVTVTNSGSVFSADKTYAEMVNALNAGKTIVVDYGGYSYYLGSYDGDIEMVFYCVNVDGVNKLMVETDWDSDTWSYEIIPFSDFALKPAAVTDLSSTNITLTSAADNTIYQYGELSALIITAITAAGDFIIRFTSGATATVLTVPNSMIMPDGFAVEANTRYEINVSNGYALVAGWAVSA